MKRSSESIERALPYSADAEKAILGAALLRIESLWASAEKLKIQDFFLERNRKIFERMNEIADNHGSLDLVSLSETLDRHGELDSVGGSEYLFTLTEGGARAKNVDEYIRAVKRHSLLRRVIRVAEAVQQVALDKELDQSVERAILQFTEIAYDAQESGHEISSFRDAAGHLLTRLSEQKETAIGTGVTDLDAIIGGFLPGELILLTASETGTGKSIFAMQIRRNGCQQGMHTLYCSGEMDAPHLLSRDIATEAKIPRWKMRQPKYLDENERSRIVEAASHQCKVCHIHDGELTLTSIRSVARNYKHQGNLDCVIVDYDELVEAPGKDDLAKQVALVRGLKSLAIELKIPVILVSQLRKALDAKDAARPSLARIYGSGAKTKHATMVIFIDREYLREANGDEAKAVIHMLKNRDGRKGYIECAFSVENLSFTNPSAQQKVEWTGAKEEKSRKRSRKDVDG